MRNWVVYFFLCLLSSCGYRSSFQEQEGAPLSIQVPYISGDVDAQLNNELVYQLGSSGRFTPVQTGGDLILKVTILSDERDRIGFRYDRDNPSGDREKNLLGVETRRTVGVEVELLDRATEKVLVGPARFSSFVDYDYTDPGSPRDLLFADKEPIIQFSLGQLDSAEGAYDDSAKPLARRLSQRIVLGLLNSGIGVEQN